MTSENSKIILELALKLDNLVNAKELLLENNMSEITIEFLDPKQKKLHFYKDQVLKFDLVEDILLALMDGRIDDINGTIQRIITIKP